MVRSNLLLLYVHVSSQLFDLFLPIVVNVLLATVPLMCLQNLQYIAAT